MGDEPVPWRDYHKSPRRRGTWGAAIRAHYQGRQRVTWREDVTSRTGQPWRPVSRRARRAAVRAQRKPFRPVRKLLLLALIAFAIIVLMHI